MPGCTELDPAAENGPYVMRGCCPVRPLLEHSALAVHAHWRHVLWALLYCDSQVMRSTETRLNAQYARAAPTHRRSCLSEDSRSNPSASQVQTLRELSEVSPCCLTELRMPGGTRPWRPPNPSPTKPPLPRALPCSRRAKTAARQVARRGLRGADSCPPQPTGARPQLCPGVAPHVWSSQCARARCNSRALVALAAPQQ